jgi:hypothetical protein
MAVATKVKPTAKAAPQEQVETREEPQVVVDPNLGKILKKYSESEKQTQSIWLQIVEYVKEQDLSRDVVKASYIQFRGVQENTAQVEVSLIFTACKEEHAENLQKALDGEMTVRDFRKSIMKPREGKEAPDPEKKLVTKLKMTARFAIENCDIDDPKDFGRMAREHFTSVLERYAEQEEDASTNGEDESDEDEAAD